MQDGLQCQLALFLPQDIPHHGLVHVTNPQPDDLAEQHPALLKYGSVHVGALEGPVLPFAL